MWNDIDSARSHTLADITLVGERRRKFIQNAKDWFVKSDVNNLAAPGLLPRL